MTSFRTLAFSALLPLSFVVLAQTPPAPTPTPGPQGAPQGMPQGGPGGPRPAPAAANKPRPYGEVITKEAVSQDGFFKVHQIDEKVYFEISPEALERDMLWRTTIAGGGSTGQYAGAPLAENVVRFSRRGNRVLLRAVDYGLRAEADDDGTKTNVEANTVMTIIASFSVQAEGPNGTVVIDVSSTFLGNPNDFGVTRPTPGASPDPSRSFVEKVKAFPTNIEVDTTQTLNAPPAGASTVKVHYSMVALPEKPMMGRLSDSRIGFFATEFDTLGGDKNRRETKGYITRFRLEKKDPNAAISEPVKPITWYLSKEIPAKWRPWVKKGIEDWQVAFQQAGFKGGIVAKDAPDDPDWSPADARYSVVRWSPTPIENAFAGPIVDPRSGETIQSVMVIYNDVMKLAAGWYFAQCGAVDPRAGKLPMDDELQGELIRYVVAHECGHAIGLYHNWKASSHYSVQQLRDPKFTSENGVSASIMDYSRFNYVAQPGDGVKRLIGMVGPYDKYAIEWGYKPIPSATKPSDEEKTLDGWLARQVTDPRLRYWPESDPVDAAAQNEDISNDAVSAGRLGLRNLDRIAKKVLIPGTVKFGEDYGLLAETYQRLLTQRAYELRHVTKLVAGVVGTDWHGGRGGDVYAPVPKAKQKEAVAFLLTEGLIPSADLYAPAILNKVQATGWTSSIAAQQYSLLVTLLQEARLQRLADQESQNPTGAYTVAELMEDVTKGAFSQLTSAKPKIGGIQRSLQRSYLRVLDTKVNPTTPSTTDAKAYAVSALQRLLKQIDTATPKAADEATRAHLVALKLDIRRILEGKYSVSTPAAPAGPQLPQRAVKNTFECGWPSLTDLFDDAN